jgi:hypothetical protein
MPARLSPVEGTQFTGGSQPTFQWAYGNVACPPSAFRITVTGPAPDDVSLDSGLLPATAASWDPPPRSLYPSAGCPTYAWIFNAYRSDGSLAYAIAHHFSVCH